MSIINLIGVSGGKDSSVLLGWAIHDSGYPIDSIRVSFTDTEFEYQEVYDQIVALNKICVANGVAPIIYLRSSMKSTPLGFKNLVRIKGRFPSAKARFCTELLKLYPVKHLIEYFWIQGFDVVAHSGVRAAESDERAQLSEFDFDNFFKVKVRRPLLSLTILDVWNFHKKYNIPINPLYFTGRKRVGCKLCVMSRKQDVRLTVKNNPEVIKEISDFEKELWLGVKKTRFFHASTVPKIQRSIPFVTKFGEHINVASIEDVARWSQTVHGGKQGGFDFMFEEDDDFDVGVACKSAMGQCE